jgi:hypothetical protein
MLLFVMLRQTLVGFGEPIMQDLFLLQRQRF